MLKNLALLGFNEIIVIDMNTIDLSNLNRQFLFREQDIGQPKAEKSANFINNRIKGVKVTQIFDGIPFIDGGTEDFKGQARVVILNNQENVACFECSLNLFNRQVTYLICTIVNIPHLPEHCIEWAFVLEWPRVFPDKKLDKDDPEHVTWLQKVAMERAKQFNIEGITYALTQGVIKNIITAFASTNVVILFIVMKPECPVCSNEPLKMMINKVMSLEDFIEIYKKPEILAKNLSIRANDKSIRMIVPPVLEESTRANLKKALFKLFIDNAELNITDSSIHIQLRIIISLQ